jgi:hypothetical protein
MSDDEYYEEEVTSNTSKKGDDAFAKAKVGAKKGELDEQLREYIGEWRKQRAKEEEELKRMKDKQAKRKEIRAEQGGSLDRRHFASDHVILLCSSFKWVLKNVEYIFLISRSAGASVVYLCLEENICLLW